MGEENTRVDFNAPKSLVKWADSVVEILDISLVPVSSSMRSKANPKPCRTTRSSADG